MYLRDQFDSDDNDDDFWTHEDDKFLNTNYEDENSSTSSRKWRSKPKTTDNRAGSPDQGDLVRASTNDLINALDQMMKNLDLDEENHPENFSRGFSVDDDLDD